MTFLTHKTFLLSFRLLALLTLAARPGGADVTVDLDAGSSFIIDGTGAFPVFRVEEATSDIFLGSSRFIHRAGTNVFIGAGAGALLTTGAVNMGVGIAALQGNSTGNRNSAFGTAALMNNNGSDNSAFGSLAMQWSLNTSENSAFGSYALWQNNGSANSAFGAFAIAGINTGFGNSAFGMGALSGNTTGSGNVAFGRSALVLNSTGGSNSAFGEQALSNATTGSDNVAVGRLAGSNQTTGSNNIYLANIGAAAENGQVKIGTVGTHTQATIAGIHGNTSSGGIAVMVNASGTLGTIVSSARFKREVRDMGEASVRLMALRPVTFGYRDEAGSDGQTQEYGLIAEEVAEVAPELVVRDEKGKPYSVRYHLLTPMLLNELQKQQRTIEAQAAEIAALRAGQEGVIATLSAVVERFEDGTRLAQVEPLR